MKVLLSWPYSLSVEGDQSDCLVVLIPTKQLFERMLWLMDKAEKLETQIDGFIQMAIQDWNPLFIGPNKLWDISEELDSMFHEVEVAFTAAELEKLAEDSHDVRIESCVAFVEKGRAGWKFYEKHCDVPCYTGTLDREYVEKQLVPKSLRIFDIDPQHALIAEAKAFGLELTECPGDERVGGAVLAADVPWVDWYNEGRNTISVLGAIAWAKANNPALSHCAAALVAYVEFHRWRSR